MFVASKRLLRQSRSARTRLCRIKSSRSVTSLACARRLGLLRVARPLANGSSLIQAAMAKRGIIDTSAYTPAVHPEYKEIPRASEDVIADFNKTVQCVDGSAAAAHAAYGMIDSAFVYPITPSSVMGEMIEEWSLKGIRNCFGQSVELVQMQSEGGAAGALHGAVLSGALSTTFTSSQGLLLMIPNMYRLAGELQPAVIHVSTRALATHALNIFGDHSDIMAVKQCGWTMLCADSVQAAYDMALVSHLTTLDTRVPIVHFFEGFRTSHEINKISVLPNETVKAMIPQDLVTQHRQASLHPWHPHIQANSHGAGVFMQAAEAANPHMDAVPGKLRKWMDKVSAATGRHYKFFDYVGHPEAEEVVVIMGTAGNTVEQYISARPGKKLGVIKTRLYRPWVAEDLLAAIPKTCKRMTVLDRVRDYTADAEPLFQDVATSLTKSRGRFRDIEVFGGRYGLGGKEFTPSMVNQVFENMTGSKRQRFTCGVTDDVTMKSLTVEKIPDIMPVGTKQCIFYGLGSDGTVGANKTAIKMIGENTDQHVQAYFQYDSKKSGSRTVSHLRFGPEKVEFPYNVQDADYIAIHREKFVHDTPKNLLGKLKEGGTVVLNARLNEDGSTMFPLPAEFKHELVKKKAEVYAIDAIKMGQELGLGKHINMVMQSVFFHLTKIIPFDKAAALLKVEIGKMFKRKGAAVIEKNQNAVDNALKGLVKLDISDYASAEVSPKTRLMVGSEFTEDRLEYIAKQMDPMNSMTGDMAPVSNFTPGGIMPLGTAAAEKRGIAVQVPKVSMEHCTQCNYCSVVCPHAAVRPFLMTAAEKEAAPATVRDTAMPAIGGGALDNYDYRIQVSPLDCTGCELCVRACPSPGALHMVDMSQSLAEKEDENWNYLIELENHGSECERTTVKGSQFQRPLCEFSGACEGCGETGNVKMLTQLFGDRLVLANATGCSRVWGATVSSAYTTYKGRGPALANSLFEDNAEFGFGMLMAHENQQQLLVSRVQDTLDDGSVAMSEELRRMLQQWVALASVASERHLPDRLLEKGQSEYDQLATRILPHLEKEKDSHSKLKEVWDLRDNLTKIAHWMLGGDGWAYDIGFGGIDHVLASGKPIKIMVLDTEAYANTGGQASKATNFAASQKYDLAGRSIAKKDLGRYAISTYGNVYVASICLNANHGQAVKAMLEAEAYPGPALVIAYSPCINHGYPLKGAIEQCRKAVASGYWPLYRFNPSLVDEGLNPLQLDSSKITEDVLDMMKSETRFAAVMNTAFAKKQEANLRELIVRRAKQMQSMARGIFGTEGDIPEKADGVVVLYGSETGNAEDLAKTLVSDFVLRGMKGCKVSAMDEFDFEQLANVKKLICVVATCGQGEYPQNCREFWKQLSRSDLPKDLLKDTTFSVFGLGDSTYAKFCVTAKEMDARLTELGATSLNDVAFGDDVDEDRYYTGYEEWVPSAYSSLELPSQPLERKPPQPSYIVDVATGGSEEVTADEWLHPVGSVPVQLKENTLLTPADYDRDIRHYVFGIADSPLRYSAGESLAIWPKNPMEKVEDFCDFYKLQSSDELSVFGRPEARNTLPLNLSVRQMFHTYLDIFGKPTKKFFEHMLNFANDDLEQKHLELLITDSAEGKAALRAMFDDMVTYADVLSRFPKTQPPLVQLMNMVPAIRPRSYSISSSPTMHPSDVELTVVKVDWDVPSTGEQRFGLCTDYLCDKEAGAVVHAAVRQSAITVPPDVRAPIIMAGMGTGLAPWRAMTQERVALKRSGMEVGPCVIFYGARKRASEYLYEEEMESYVKEGALEMHTAFSRDQAHKIYVQHRIEEQGATVFDYMVNKGGYFYVCGSSKNIPEDVYAAMRNVFKKHGNVNGEAADAMLSKLKEDGRYIIEAWA